MRGLLIIIRGMLLISAWKGIEVDAEQIIIFESFNIESKSEDL